MKDWKDRIWNYNEEIEAENAATGDTMLKKNSVEHGGTCLKKGILLDIFASIREDFLN